MLEPHESCPLCQGSRLSDLYPDVDGFTIARCAACGLVFVKERLEPRELARYYEPDAGNVVYADAENVENLNHYFLRLKALVEERVPKGRVLDVGCSGGYFLDVMEGWERYGIEIPSVWAEMSRAKYGENVHAGTLDDAPWPDGTFDLITLQDVFDHLAEPLPSLGTCRRLLKPGGLLAIKVHNISCLWARAAGRGFYALIPPFHLFYYDERTLKLALAKAGFAHEASAFIGHTLFLKTVPFRLARNARSGFFWQAYRLLDRLPIGKLKIRKNLHDIITVLGRRPL